MKIFKYPIEIVDRQLVQLPMGAKILTFQVQGGQPCIWCLVNENAGYVTSPFLILGTGHPFPEDVTDFEYIGTIQMDIFVWHLFDLRHEAWKG